MSAAALVPRLLLDVDPLTVPQLRVEGTAVLVDISGFTTLSEQLAAAGREGTEQLIATLSRIFTVLLPVTDDGGDIVKFAGDALFILFTGDEHAKHAVHAAWNMNRVLSAIGDIHLPSARARLRMSVGIHSGIFEFHLSGAPSTNVVMTGRDTTRVLELQSAADAGRILVSDETAALLPPKQTVPELSAPGSNRLLRAGTVRTASLMALVRATGGERFLPRAFAQRPDLLAAEPDHRWAAIGFVQVSGVPDAPDSEDFAHIDALTAEVEAALADTGGTLLDIDPAPGGYRYFVTAGAPTTVEDPEGRLLTALHRIVTTDTPLSVRAGAASGRVFAGFVGAPNRQTYTVMGDETNLAARLTARAAPGTVLVTSDSLERSAVTFGYDDGGEITVKGKSQTIPVAVITSGGSRPAAGPAETPFHGRLTERDRIRGFADSAAAGLGGVMTIVGPAGIGKTRLVDEALAECELRVIRLIGDRFGIGAPYRTVQSLLRPLLGIPPDATPADAGAMLADAVGELRRTLIPWVPLLAPFVGAEVHSTPVVDALDDAFRLEKAHSTLGKLIDDLLPEPTCIVIDDAQWVDPSSAVALAAALADDLAHAVFVLRRPVDGGLTMSDPASADPESSVVELAGLSDDDGTDLVEAVAGRMLLPSDLAPILSRADGNPLYLTELAAGMSAGSDTLGIEQLVGERLDALSEADRAIVRRAAVLGWGVPVNLFVRCVGPAELVQSEGVGGFLELLEESIRFRSGLYRDVAYEQLNYQTRRELHRAVAAALLSDHSLAGLATNAMLTVHHEAAGDWEKAFAAAISTAEAAERALAMDEATSAYRVAVAAAGRMKPPPAEFGAVWEALGRVAVASGRTTEALEAYSSARKLAKDAATRARIDVASAFALNVLGRSDEAAKALRTARRGAVDAGDAGRGILASIAVTESGLRLRQAEWAEARRLAGEAIVLLDGARDDDDKRRLADAYRYQDIAAGELEGDAAMVNLERALALYDEVGDELSRSKVLNVLGARAYYRGDWTTAVDLYGQAVDASERGGDVVGVAVDSGNVAEILIDQGRLDEARPMVKRSLRVFTASGNHYLWAYVTGFLGRIAVRAGTPDEAHAAFSEAAAMFETMGEVDEVLDVTIRRLEADLDRGDLEGARASITQLDAAGVRGPARSRLLRHTSRLAAIDGDDTAAAAAAAAAVDAAGDSPFDRALALAQLAACTGADAPRAAAQAILGDLGVVDISALLAVDQGTHLANPLDAETTRS